MLFPFPKLFLSDGTSGFPNCSSLTSVKQKVGEGLLAKDGQDSVRLVLASGQAPHPEEGVCLGPSEISTAVSLRWDCSGVPRDYVLPLVAPFLFGRPNSGYILRERL